MNRSVFTLIVLVGVIGAWVLSGMKVDFDYVEVPFLPGLRYEVTQIWQENDGQPPIVWHKLIKSPNTIRSFRLPVGAEVVSTDGQSWVEIGEKNPTKLAINPRCLKKIAPGEFEGFLRKTKVLFRAGVVLFFAGIWAFAFFIWPYGQEGKRKKRSRLLEPTELSAEC